MSRRTWGCGLAMALAALASAPAAQAAHAHAHHPRTLRIVATDSATSPLDAGHPHFELSVTHGQALAAGLVRIDLSNSSRMMNHQAQVARLHRGVSLREFVTTAREKGDGAAMALVDPAGGPDTVAPGGRQTTWQRLSAGRYVVICLVDMPDGTTHLDAGMVAGFRVAGRPSGRTRPPGHVAGTITAWTRGGKMGFTLPSGFTGHGLYRFRNAASEDEHELSLLALAPGKTVADVVSWFKHPGPPPFAGAGGISALPPGGEGWVRLRLQPGDYVATCFVPGDDAQHLPHGAMGMDRGFTIR